MKDKDISHHRYAALSIRINELKILEALVSVSYNDTYSFFVPRLRGTFELDYIYLRLLFALPVRTSR